jgi:hypothetical protein
MMCGCIGQSGGGWAHYVGQEKLRPQTGWAPLAFGLDWHRPSRQMNSTSYFYAHTSQWRHEKLAASEILSPTANKDLGDYRLIDFNVRAERMGWLPSAPQLDVNPLEITQAADAAGIDPVKYAVEQIKSGAIKFACEDPDNPKNFPRNLFVWRSNLLGSSGKGHEYFLKYLLGTQNAVLGPDLGELGEAKPKEVVWHDKGAEGKLDLLVTLDFRMSTTCLYSDIVLPSSTWYEKDDLNTSDMHPFIHPLSEAVQPLWESKSDWEIYKTIAKKFSEIAAVHLGTQKDLVLTPLMHDTPSELGQSMAVRDWKKGEVDAIPGKTMPSMTVVTRDYGDTYKQVHRAGPLDDQDRQRRQGHCLEHRGRGEAAGRAELHRHRGRRRQGPAEHRLGHRRLRGHPHAGAGNQRPGRGEGLGSAVEDHRTRPHASGDPARGRQDPLPRCRGAAAEDHFLAHLVGPGVRARVVQRRLHQRPRADPVAHADRPPAVLPGPPVDAGFRRGPVRVQAAGRHQDDRADAGQERRTATTSWCSTGSPRTRSGASTAPTPTTCAC